MFPIAFFSSGLLEKWDLALVQKCQGRTTVGAWAKSLWQLRQLLRSLQPMPRIFQKAQDFVKAPKSLWQLRQLLWSLRPLCPGGSRCFQKAQDFVNAACVCSGIVHPFLDGLQTRSAARIQRWCHSSATEESKNIRVAKRPLHEEHAGRQVQQIIGPLSHDVQFTTVHQPLDLGVWAIDEEFPTILGSHLRGWDVSLSHHAHDEISGSHHQATETLHQVAKGSQIIWLSSWHEAIRLHAKDLHTARSKIWEVAERIRAFLETLSVICWTSSWRSGTYSVNSCITVLSKHSFTSRNTWQQSILHKMDWQLTSESHAE